MLKDVLSYNVIKEINPKVRNPADPIQSVIKRKSIGTFKDQAQVSLVPQWRAITSTCIFIAETKAKVITSYADIL